VTDGQNAEISLRREVRKFVEEIAIYVPADHQLADDDDLLALGAIDSLGFVQLVEEVEGRFGIRVGDDEITEANFGSVNAIAAFVQRRQ
jgi:acyl carrier protein